MALLVPSPKLIAMPAEAQNPTVSGAGPELVETTNCAVCARQSASAAIVAIKAAMAVLMGIPARGLRGTARRQTEVRSHNTTLALIPANLGCGRLDQIAIWAEGL